MAWASRVPDVIDVLVQRLSVADGLADVDVRDGPAIASPSARQVLGVGYAGQAEETDVEATVGRDGLTDEREQFTIRCAVAVLSGDTDVAAARQCAYGLLAAAGAAIARDRTLGGLVLRAGIGGHSLMQEQTDRGIQATVVFTVDCDAFAVR